MTSSLSRLTPRPWLLIVLLVPFIGLCTLMVAAGSGQVVPPPVSPKSHPVDVMPLALSDNYQQERLAYGRIESAQQTQAGFELAGTVLEVMVDEGDAIVRGQVLARLDTQRLDARMTELNASLARAQAEARLAKLSEKRVAELVKEKLDSPQRLDEVRETTTAAEAVVNEIQARKDSIKVELSKSLIKAPFDGAVLARPVDPGTVVAAGQPILVLQQNSQFEARIALPADDVFRMQQGASYQLRYVERDVSARIKSIAKRRTLDTRTVDVMFALDPSHQDLLPGDMLALPYLKTIRESGAWVPRQALNSGVRGLWTLFTVAAQGQQPVSAKTVEVLYADEQRAYVRGAIKSGDLLVLSGVHRLVPDQLVTATLAPEKNLAKAD